MLLYTMQMAKINKVSRAPMYQIDIHVQDPECIFNINPICKYGRIFKANSVKAAIKQARTYCNKKMKEYKGVQFSYDSASATEYYYPCTTIIAEPTEKASFTISKY